MFDDFFHSLNNSDHDSHREAASSFEEFANAPPEKKQGHPKTAGAVAFLAMKAYDHQAKGKGKKPIGTMKEILASIAVAEVDKLVEEKAIPATQTHFHKEKAVEHAHAMADERLSVGDGVY